MFTTKSQSQDYDIQAHGKRCSATRLRSSCRKSPPALSRLGPRPSREPRAAPLHRGCAARASVERSRLLPRLLWAGLPSSKISVTSRRSSSQLAPSCCAPSDSPKHLQEPGHSLRCSFRVDRTLLRQSASDSTSSGVANNRASTSASHHLENGSKRERCKNGFLKLQFWPYDARIAEVRWAREAHEASKLGLEQVVSWLGFNRSV